MASNSPKNPYLKYPGQNTAALAQGAMKYGVGNSGDWVQQAGRALADFLVGAGGAYASGQNRGTAFAGIQNAMQGINTRNYLGQMEQARKAALQYEQQQQALKQGDNQFFAKSTIGPDQAQGYNGAVDFPEWVSKAVRSDNSKQDINNLTMGQALHQSPYADYGNIGQEYLKRQSDVADANRTITREPGLIQTGQGLNQNVAIPSIPQPQPQQTQPGIQLNLPTAKNPYAAQIQAAAQKHGVDPNLLTRLVSAESAFNPKARSGVGAIGLTQLMPGTAKSLGVKNPYDPVQNLDGGAKYLAQQLARFGSPEKAIAAYNAGPGAVQKYGGVPPYRETQAYVKKIMKGYSPQDIKTATRMIMNGNIPIPKMTPAVAQKQPLIASAQTQQTAPLVRTDISPYIQGAIPPSIVDNAYRGGMENAQKANTLEANIQNNIATQANNTNKTGLDAQELAAKIQGDYFRNDPPQPTAASLATSLLTPDEQKEWLMNGGGKSNPNAETRAQQDQELQTAAAQLKAAEDAATQLMGTKNGKLNYKPGNPNHDAAVTKLANARSLYEQVAQGKQAIANKGNAAAANIRNYGTNGQYSVKF